MIGPYTSPHEPDDNVATLLSYIRPQPKGDYFQVDYRTTATRETCIRP